MSNKEPFRLGARPLHERLTEELPALTEAVLAAVTTRVPAYGLMPSEELAGDINRVIVQTLKSFIVMVRTKSLPGEEELAFMRESAARRAEEGIPIEFVLTAYHIGVQVVWESLTPDVRPAEVQDVMAVNSLALRYLELITPAVGAGYLDQHQTIFDDERSARHTLLTALLDGMPADAAASRTGFRLPPCYLVLALSVGAHPDETEPGVDQLVAGRRKLRRLRSELERQVRGPVLSSLTPEGGIALLPHPAPVGEVTARDWNRLKRVIADVARAAGAEITAGVTAVVPQEVAAAAKLADEIRTVATASGKPGGMYRLDDVLLQYQLSRPSAAHDRLAAMLQPLDGNDELLQTLETYLRRGSRRPTATDLHVHPNTVDYRLRRIAELTGLDPTSVTDIALINAALTARAAQP